jgi:cold shock CspA family protein
MECDKPGDGEECILQDANGTCIWFDRKKGYGFIEMERTEAVANSLPIPAPNVFAHQSEVQMDGFRFLHPNRRVCCDVYKTPDSRYRATRIRQT